MEGTQMDYPVMQTPDDPNFYLYRNFDKQDSARGSIYAREVCDINKPSDNITLFGHNMADGSMFANIIYFKWAYYFNSHPYVYFDTLYEHRTYRVVLVFRTNGAPSDKYPFFPFHTYSDFRDEEEFDYFMSSIRNLALLESGVDVKYGDKLLCLSTCDFDPYPNGRMVLVAKLIE
jgi:sortase B